MGTVPFCPTRVADPSLHSLTHAYPSHTRRCLHRGRERCPASGRCAAGPARGRSPARPAARTGCTSLLPTLHTPTHTHQRQRVLQRQQLLQRRLVQLRDHVHTAATTPSVHAVDGEDGAVVERLQGYPSAHTRFPTGYLRHGMIADVPVLHRTHFRTHTLRKELRLTLSLHSHILRTLHLFLCADSVLCIRDCSFPAQYTPQQRNPLAVASNPILSHSTSTRTRNRGCVLFQSLSPIHQPR